MSTSTTERTKTVVRRHIDALNERDRETFAECFSTEALPHGMDIDEFVDTEFAYFDAFPDLHYPIHELIAEDEMAALRWTFEGVHSQQGGPDWLAAIEPTHEEVAVSGINIARVEKGKIIEYTGEWSVHELLDQLGIISLPE